MLIGIIYFAAKIFSLDLGNRVEKTTVFTTAHKNGHDHPVQMITEKRYVLGNLVNQQTYVKFDLGAQVN